MNSTNLTADLFISGVYGFRDEAFDMQSLLSGDELVGGASPHPALPGMLSLDLGVPLMSLEMYTNNLQRLAAPRELCVLKALELMSSRRDYQLNVEAFRLDLLCNAFDVNDFDGAEDVNALIKGIECICQHLWGIFDNYVKSHEEFFPYEFYCLHKDRYLFLTKIVFDASIPADNQRSNPATIAKPAYAYQGTAEGHGAPYLTTPSFA